MGGDQIFEQSVCCERDGLRNIEVLSIMNPVGMNFAFSQIPLSFLIMQQIALVRCGVIPQVEKYRLNGCGSVERDQVVVVRGVYGLQIGTILSQVDISDETSAESQKSEILRVATSEDLDRFDTNRREATGEFAKWEQLIEEWKLDLQLIDLEWTLEREKLILYVLNERGPESTKLALYAAARGLGPVEIIPVDKDGPIAPESQSSGCCSSDGG